MFPFILFYEGEREDLNSASDITTDLIKDYVHTVKNDVDELDNQNKCLELQHTFRPIFLQYFKANLYHRYKAVTFRRVLSENGHDLNGLEEIWKTKGKVSTFIVLFLKLVLYDLNPIRDLEMLR